MKRLTALLLSLVLLLTGVPAASAVSESSADGTAVILPEDVPSPWAYEEVKQAIVLGMVPSSLQNHWRFPVTRVEFAQMVVRFLGFQYGYAKDSSFVSDYCAQTADREGNHFGPGSWWNVFCGAYGPFTDLHLPEDRGYGNTAYSLGIMDGRGGGIFDPKGLLTRQEAACILMRCYRRYGGEYTGGELSSLALDWEEVAGWAGEDVAAVLDLKVMNGTAAGHFDPLGTYTREQAVLTLLRLYANAPVSRGKGNIPKV